MAELTKSKPSVLLSRPLSSMAFPPFYAKQPPDAQIDSFTVSVSFIRMAEHVFWIGMTML
jgi:hypothetical protein